MDPSRFGTVLLTRWGASSDVGPVRTRNEDAWLADPPLFALADGMGGHADGQLAAATALRALSETPAGTDPDLDGLDRGISAAALAVSALAGDDPVSAPGTTLTGVLAGAWEDHPCWLVFNIGDSRVCLVADGAVAQLTEDHATRQDGRTVLTQFLGAGLAGLPDPDFVVVRARRGDRLVLSSDGLHGVVAPDAIGRIVEGQTDPQAAATALTDAALAAGARDNVTVVVVEAAEVSPAWPDDEPAGAALRPLLRVRRAQETTSPRPAEQTTAPRPAQEGRD